MKILPLSSVREHIRLEFCDIILSFLLYLGEWKSLHRYLSP
jgi:hypothetical protein